MLPADRNRMQCTATLTGMECVEKGERVPRDDDPVGLMMTKASQNGIVVLVKKKLDGLFVPISAFLDLDEEESMGGWEGEP